MTKIAHYVSSGGFSGAEKVAIEMMKISAESFDSSYIAPNGFIQEVLASENLSYIDAQSASLKNIIKANQIDILYCHDFKATLKGALCFSKAKKISHIHQNPTWLKKVNIKSLLFLFSTLFMSRIVFVSTETKDDFIFKRFINKKSIILANYVNADEVIEKSQLTQSQDIFDVIYLGRFEDVKNPLFFVELVKQLVENNDNLKAVMVGDGILFKEAQDAIASYGLEANIKLMGYQNNPYPILKNSKILVIPSLWEGFGLNAVESMILGVPVVARPVGGLTHVITPEAGFFANDLNEFQNSIETLLSNATEWQSKSNASVKNAKRFTDTNKWKFDVNRLFTDVVEKGSR